MTTPEERTRAILLAHDFLRGLAYHRPGVPEHVRHQAKALLRHYPDAEDMRVAHGACPCWFGNPEESESDNRRRSTSHKLLGLEWLVAHSEPILIGIGIAFAITVTILLISLSHKFS